MWKALTSIAHPLPGIALLPLVILFFGTGTASILMIVIHAVLWPMVINFNAGFSSVKQTYIDLGRNYEYGRMGIIRHILIPSSWVYVVAGLRIAWARSWRAVISAEMVFGVIGAYGGLGWYIFNKRVFMDTPGMYAGLLVLIIIGPRHRGYGLRFTREARTSCYWGSQMSTMVCFEGVSFSYCTEGNKNQVFSGLDLSIPAGEFTCILGNSGCGKSTLLRLAAGFEVQDHGIILIDGKAVTSPGMDRAMVLPGVRPAPSVEDGI